MSISATNDRVHKSSDAVVFFYIMYAHDICTLFNAERDRGERAFEAPFRRKIKRVAHE